VNRSLRRATLADSQREDEIVVEIAAADRSTSILGANNSVID